MDFNRSYDTGDAPRFQPADIRIALSLGPEVPVVLCDARQRFTLSV